MKFIRRQTQLIFNPTQSIPTQKDTTMTTTTPHITIETITPDMAKVMLECSDFENRVLRRGVVDLYAQDMKAGRWIVTGEPIVMNGTSVINGQHRLNACIQADIAFMTAIMRNADPMVYDVIDSGLKRIAADVLKADGHGNWNTVAAAAKLVIAYRAGCVSDGAKGAMIANRHAIKDEANENRDLYELSLYNHRKVRSDGFNASALSAFFVLLAQSTGDIETTKDFTDSLISGENLTHGDPRLAMRRWVISARRSNRIHHLAALIRCYNAYVKGEKRTAIKGWDHGQPFPVLVA